MEHALSNLLYANQDHRSYFGIGFDADGAIQAADTSRLLQWLLSRDPADRIEVANSLTSLPNLQYFGFALRLLKDPESTVQQAILTAFGYPDRFAFAHELVQAVDDTESRRVAKAFLVALGSAALPAISRFFPSASKQARIRLLRVLQRIGGSPSVALVADRLPYADEVELTASLQALGVDRNQIGATLRPLIERQTRIEVQQTSNLLALHAELGAATTKLPAVRLLEDVVAKRLARCRQRFLCCLSMLVDSQPKAGPLTARALLPNTLGQDVVDWLLAAPPSDTGLSQPRLGLTERLIQVLEPPQPIYDSWLWVCAAYAAQQLNLTDPRIIAAVSATRDNVGEDSLIQETAKVVLAHLLQRNRTFNSPRQPSRKAATENCPEASRTMLSTIEKVIFLKGADLFHEVPDVVLIELASLLEELEVEAGTTIFGQGTAADCMYIIVAGRFEIHNRERVLNHQGSGDVFGELALLDAAPRLASVTAVEDSRLLRLDQEGFYLLMEDHIEFVRGVIRVLSGYLRGNLRHIGDQDLYRT